MAAITDFDEYVAALKGPRELQQFTKLALSATAGRNYSPWVTGTLNGSAPTTAAVPTNTTTGALGQENAGTETLYMVGGRATTSFPGHFTLYDRLAHQGGLSGTVTTAQATNLPTATITRGSAVGVWAALQIYTQIGTTATTVSVSYTNSAGTAGRTSPLVVFGATGNREAGRVILLPVVAGDNGVQSVESVTVTATTGTAGAFGVTLIRPLLTVCVDTLVGNSAFDFVSGGACGGIPEIPDGACLDWIYMTQGTTAFIGALRFMAV